MGKTKPPLIHDSSMRGGRDMGARLAQLRLLSSTEIGSEERRDHRGRRPRRRTTHRWTSCSLFFLLLATLFSATSVTSAQVPVNDARIAEIKLLGLDRVSEAEVLARMRVRVGDRFDQRSLDQEYDRLFKTGQFTFIHPWQFESRPDGIHISIRFEEKQKILDVRLSGMEALSRPRTLEDLATRKGELLDTTGLRTDEETILQKYYQDGYIFAAVEHETVPLPGGVQVIFRVYEGSRVTMSQVVFDGAESFGNGELLDQVGVRSRSWFLGIPNSGKLQRDILFRSVDSLRAFYRRKGFFDAQVALGPLEFNEKRDQVLVRFRVQEGPRYHINQIRFDVEGQRVFTDQELTEAIETKTGDPWDGDAITADEKTLEKLYSDQAYVDVRVTVDPILELTGNNVALLFRIIEGEKIFIEEVKIRGNEETRDKVIRRQLTFYPGEEFRSEKIQDSVSNLYRLGYFNSVNPSWEAGSQPGYKNVIIDVEEGSTGRMIFGIGLTTGQGASGSFSLQKTNFDIADFPKSFSDIPNAFSGGGQSLTIQAQPGTQYSRYRFNFLEPYVFDTLNSLSVTGFRSAYLREDYTEQRTAGEISFGRRFLFDRRLTAEVWYLYEVVKIRDLSEDAIPSVVAVEGKTHISAITTALAYDRRVFRPIIGPVGGWNTRLGLEYAGGPLGAELDYSKATMSVNFYSTLYSDGESKRHIVTLRNDFGWEEPHHDTVEIPIYERFYLGGSSTLRGFRFREVGPKEQGEPVGGTVRHFGSLEYTFPLYEGVVRGIAFADYGNLAPDFSTYKGDEYRVAVGGGVLLNIPFLGQYLPISLTWADAIEKEDGDRTQTFLFDIGFGF